MTLIDADALLPLLYTRRDQYQKWLDDAKKQGKEYIYNDVMNMMIVINACIGEIINQPTIDSVQTGRWKKTWIDNCFFVRCSECGGLQSELSDYCPNCGRRMNVGN